MNLVGTNDLSTSARTRLGRNGNDLSFIRSAT